MRVITERFRDDEGRIIIAIDIQSINKDFNIRFEIYADVLLSLFRRK